MLFDGDGNRMTPTHAAKKGRRYRYYVSRPLITNDQTDRSAGLRTPAGEIEQAVTSRIRQWLVDPGGVYQAKRLADPAAQRRLIARAGEIGKSWSELPATRQRTFLTALIDRIDGGANRIDIHLRSTRLGMLLDNAATSLSSATDEVQILAVPIELHHCGREIKMLIEGTDPFADSQTRCADGQAADQSAPVQRHPRRRRRRAVCRTGQARGREPILFHAAPPQSAISRLTSPKLSSMGASRAI
jgi:hypothetical protein